MTISTELAEELVMLVFEKTNAILECNAERMKSDLKWAAQAVKERLERE